MARYFARFSIITQARMAIRAKTIGRPDGAILILASRIPVKMGTRTIAPNALELVLSRFYASVQGIHD